MPLTRNKRRFFGILLSLASSTRMFLFFSNLLQEIVQQLDRFRYLLLYPRRTLVRAILLTPRNKHVPDFVVQRPGVCLPRPLPSQRRGFLQCPLRRISQENDTMVLQRKRSNVFDSECVKMDFLFFSSIAFTFQITTNRSDLKRDESMQIASDFIGNFYVFGRQT